MSWSKLFSLFNWENRPSDKTPLGAALLQKLNNAINGIDDRVITLQKTKLEKATAYEMVKDISLDEATGIFTVTYLNGAAYTLDTKLEKLAVNFYYDKRTQQLVITLDDGTKQHVDMKALVTQYEFKDSATLTFSTDTEGNVTATIKSGSVTEDMLQPNYLADIKVEVAKAQSSATAAGKSETNAATSADTATTNATAAANSATAAKTSETNAKTSETNAGNSAKKAESYAVGGTGTRTGEDTDNAKYYSQTASGSAEAAKTGANTATAKATAASNSASAAKTSETNAKTSETNADTSAGTAASKAIAASESATAAATSEKNAAKSATNAASSESTASAKASAAATSAIDASESATAAATSEKNAASSAAGAAKSASSASSSASNANNSKTSAADSADAAANSASSAAASATKANNYANGSTNSAKYYYEQAKSISESFAGALRPMGTVTFANLPSVSSAVEGDMYNVSDQFTTTSDFKEGAGNVIPAGANVYKTSDGKWDVLAGSPVTGVKGCAEEIYRRGNVDITPEDLGITVVNNTKDSEKSVKYAASAGDANTAASANGFTSSRYIDGVGFDGRSGINRYGICSTGAEETVKTVTISSSHGFALNPGTKVFVKFAKGSKVNGTITLNVNESGAKMVVDGGGKYNNLRLSSNKIYELIYDGTYWRITNDGFSQGLFDLDNAVYHGFSFYLPDYTEDIRGEHIVLSSCLKGFCPNTMSSTYSIGNSTFPWYQFYAHKTQVSTSDRNRKNSISELDNTYMTLFDSIPIKKFILNDSGKDTLTTTKNQRYHLGVIAQEVENVVRSLGLSSNDFGGVCSEFFACYGSFKTTIHGGWMAQKEGYSYSENVYNWKHRDEGGVGPFEVWNEIVEETVENLKIDSYRGNIGYIMVEDNSKLTKEQPPITVNSITFVKEDGTMDTLTFADFIRYYAVDDTGFENPLSDVEMSEDGSATVSFNKMYGCAWLKLSETVDITQYVSVMVDVDCIGEYNIMFIPDGVYQNANPYDRDRNDQILYNYMFRYDELFNLTAYALQETRKEFNAYKEQTSALIGDLNEKINRLSEKAGA